MPSALRQRRQKDRDATWTKKHNKSYFGYKLSVNVAKQYKFIRKIVMDTASTGDSCHFETAFDPTNTSRDVYADRGYPSKKRETWLKNAGYRSQIQRKGQNENAPSGQFFNYLPALPSASGLMPTHAATGTMAGRGEGEGGRLCGAHSGQDVGAGPHEPAD